MHAQATKEDIDVVICDTSGRLHTNVGLMEELAKCRRSIAKRLDGAPHETLLILDGTTGGFRLPALLQSPWCRMPTSGKTPCHISASRVDCWLARVCLAAVLYDLLLRFS